MKWKLFYIVAMLLGGYAAVSAQEAELKGRVLNAADQAPVVQARISSPAAGESVLTGDDGTFTLRLTTRNTEIRVEINGFVSRNLFVGNLEQVEIYLIPENTARHRETVELPYGPVPSREKTGSSVTLHKSELNLANDVPDQSLHGTLAGLRVLSKSGLPGEGAFLNMRGLRSIHAAHTPLMVVDGMPYLPSAVESEAIGGYSRNLFNSVHLKEVENISLVKGFDAAPYGSLGANGVILINTEKAENLDTKVEFHTVEGIGWMKKRIPVLKGAGFRSYIGDIGETANSDLEALVVQFPFLKDDPNDRYRYVYDNDTKWQDEIFTQAFTSENILKIQGGDNIANYALSVGYLYNQGILENTEQSKYYTRLNAQVTVTPKLDMFASVGFSYSDNLLMEQGLRKETNPLLAALYKSPLFSVYEKDPQGINLGKFSAITYEGVNNKASDIIGVSNPKALVSNLEARSRDYDILVNTGLNYRLNDQIALHGLVGLYYNYNSQNNFIPGKTSLAIAPLLDGLAQNTVRASIGENYNLYLNANATYKNLFDGGHGVDAALGYQLMTTRDEHDFEQGINTPSDFYKSINSTTFGIGSLSNTLSETWNWMNLYARAVYNFRQQVYVGAALTVDASSAIGEKSDLFALLPSMNIAWNLKNASFLTDCHLVDHLTVRGEYAQLANSRFSSTLSSYNYTTKPVNQLTGFVRSSVPNSHLKAETTHAYTVGLDFATFGRRVNLSVDLFREETKNMLLQRDLAAAYGFGYVYDNAGEIWTEGIEASLHVQLLKSNDFEWNAGGTIATLRSEIKALGGVSEQTFELEDGALLVNRVGESPYAFYGVKAEKVFASQAEADEAHLISHAGKRFNAGDIRFQDNVKDGVIDNKDYQLLGSAQPDFFGGFYTSVRYKGVGLSAHFTYSYGNEIYNAVRRTQESMTGYENQTEVVARRWTYDGQQTDVPRAQYGDPMQNSRFSDRWIEDGSFLKLKNITLSYDLPANLGFIKQAQVYLTGENLLTATDYLGYDPEFSYSYNPALSGVDFGKVPLARSVRLGVKMLF